MAGSEIRVMLGSRLVGWLRRSTSALAVNFRYSQEWRLTGFPLSPALPLDGTFNDESATAFFQNMLPEGRALESLTRFARLSESAVMGLCLCLRNDLPGAIRLEDDSVPMPPRTYREVSRKELSQRLDAMMTVPIHLLDGRPRLSVAGLQAKINLLKLGDKLGLADGPDLCSDRILKFEDGSIPCLLLNEYLTLSLARSAGFSVPEAALIKVGKHRVLEVIRFDRLVEGDPDDVQVRRRHVIDGCQALGLLSDRKYERNFGERGFAKYYNDGVSFLKLASLADSMENAGIYRVQLLDWMILNLLVGNADAHGKNISFVRHAKGFALAPWYDIINIRVCDGIDQTLAMSIGEAFEFDKVHALQVLREADNIGLGKDVVLERLSKIVQAVEAALEIVVPPVFATEAELAFMGRWREDIRAACRKWREEITELPFLEL